MDSAASNRLLSRTSEPLGASKSDDEPVIIHAIRDHGSFISSICIFPETSSLGCSRPVVASASWNNKVMMHDLGSGDLLHTLNCPYGETISCLSGYCQPGVFELLATFSLDGKIRIYDGLKKWDMVKCFGHSLKPTRSVLGVVKLACPDMQPICISGGIDKVLRVRKISNPLDVLFTLRGHTDSILSIDFADSGVIASGSNDTNVRLWDCASGSFLRTLRGHILGVSAVRFIHKSPWLISAGLDGIFRVWDYTTGQRLRSLKARSIASISCVIGFQVPGCIPPLAVVGGTGGRGEGVSEASPLEVWRLDTAELLGVCPGPRDEVAAIDACLAMDNTYDSENFSCYLASGGVDRLLRVWELSRFIDSFDFDRGGDSNEASEDGDDHSDGDDHAADASGGNSLSKLKNGFTLRSLESYLRDEAASVDSGSSEQEEGSESGSDGSIRMME